MKLLIAADRWLHKIMRGRCWCPWLCRKLSYHDATYYYDEAVRPKTYLIERSPSTGLYESREKTQSVDLEAIRADWRRHGK